MNVGIWSFDVNRGSLPLGEIGAYAELVSVVVDFKNYALQTQIRTCCVRILSPKAE